MTPREFPCGTRIGRKAAGEVLIRQDELRAKLGRPASVLWEILCAVRSPMGLTHITDIGMTRVRGFEKLKLWQVKLALDRLRAAGLIIPVGWRVVPVRSRLELVEKMVYLRLIRGALPTVREVDLALVPKATEEWVAKASSRGGARVGAGRPAKGQKRGQLRRLPLQVARLVANGTGGIQTRPTPLNSNYPHDIGSIYTEISSETLLSASQREDARSCKPCTACVDPALVLGFRKAPKPKSPRPSRSALEPNVDPARLGCPVGVDGALGFAVGADRVVASPHVAALGVPYVGVPGVRSVSALAPCSVPEPPMLDPKDTEAHHVKLLARWYVGAVEYRFGKRTWAVRQMNGPDPTRSKHYKHLALAAKALMEHEIAPAAWCAFSCDVWRLVNSKAHPPVRWVFDIVRISSHRGWFRRLDNDYSGGAQVFTPAGRELLRRTASMRARILREVRHGDDESLRRVVTECFPDGLYERLVAQAQAEASEENERLRAMVAIGGWVWG